MIMNAKVICIVGPTATGKSELAQQVAERFDGEILSADSMQVYKGMDIGTAKVPPSERRVAHHGIDLVDPGEPFSVALYQRYSRDAFQRIGSKGKIPVLVGGSGFYVRSAIDDYDFPKGDQQDNPIRDRWQAYLDEFGTDALWDELLKRDKRSAEAIHPNNSKRVIRALEMFEEGVCYADQLDNLKTIKPYVDTLMIGLDCPRDLLNSRIDSRVDQMRRMGLEDEVASLLGMGFRDALTAQQAIGYKEIVDAFNGNRSINQAYDDIKRATRRYAKRQRTWFRRDERIVWVDCTDPDKACAKVFDIIGSGLDRS